MFPQEKVIDALIWGSGGNVSFPKREITRPRNMRRFTSWPFEQCVLRHHIAECKHLSFSMSYPQLGVQNVSRHRAVVFRVRCYCFTVLQNHCLSHFRDLFRNGCHINTVLNKLVLRKRALFPHHLLQDL